MAGSSRTVVGSSTAVWMEKSIVAGSRTAWIESIIGSSTVIESSIAAESKIDGNRGNTVENVLSIIEGNALSDDFVYNNDYEDVLQDFKRKSKKIKES